MNVNLHSFPIHENTVTLSCPSSGPSKKCYVYLVPVVHTKEKSRRDVETALYHLRPQSVFLECYLEPKFYSYFHEGCEQGYAFKIAKALEMEIIFGDICDRSLKTCEDRKLDELRLRYGFEKDNDMELRDMAHDMAFYDVRDLIMITRLWDHAKTRSSIVAIVGEDHIYGMRHYWRLMELGSSRVLKEAAKYEEYIRQHQPPTQLNHF
ncbi:uncharacterized protein [Medicago truncatula]|uniref:uncharacterized protein n=1 Tax=Medicago truncatula TaxID=3880 RepID=UPI0019673FD7|nr:uncharacterized protein LOC120578073 [Medicago truncatula]XP_039686084.1 uncharacterized protein LOC120578075 [Medicago truncatula]